MEEKGIDVKEMRMRLNITQEEFANRLGVGIRTVQKWEAGGKIPKTKHQIIRTIANQADTNGGKQQAADTPNVKELRQRLNMTQQALANELGVSVVTIQNYERGRTIPGTMRRKLESMTAGLVSTTVAQTVASNNTHKGGGGSTAELITLLSKQQDTISRQQDTINRLVLLVEKLNN